MVNNIKTDFVLYSAIEAVSNDYKKLDMIVIKEGAGKHKIYIEEYQQFFTEFFPLDVLEQLKNTLSGAPIEAYRVAGTNVDDDDGLVHPSPEQAMITPEGLVLHGIGLWENVRIAPHPEGGNALYATAVLNETQLANHVSETVRLALERNSSFVPAPSINGYMLWEPVMDDGNPYLMARQVVNLRSTEFVNRPAAGGRLYAVVEGNVMNLLTMLKGYCAAHDIEHNPKAATVAELLDSASKDSVLEDVAGKYESDESGALAVLSKAFEVPSEGEATGELKEGIEMNVGVEEETTLEGGDQIDDAPALETEPVEAHEVNVDLSGVTDVLTQVAEGLKSMGNHNKKFEDAMAKRFASFDAKMKAVDSFISRQSTRENKNLLLSAVQESELPGHRKNFWKAQVEAGKVQSMDVLKGFLSDDIDAENGFKSQMLEGMDAEELPVSVRNLLSVDGPQEDKNYLRAKLMFGAQLTEGEQTAVNASGLHGFVDVKDMYKTLVPGDLEQGMPTGMAYGGPGGGNPRKYYEWKNAMMGRQSMQSVTGGVEVVRRGDFTGILLDVVQQVALARWDMQQLDAFDLCHVGPGFQDFDDSNLIITGAAPDMSRWNNISGFPNIETGQRKKVATEADVLGGILRWGWDVILNDRNGSALNIINTDVDNAIDATYRTIVKAIIDAIMGWDTAINTYEPDSDGVLYQAPAPTGGGAVRRNYYNADGRSYNSLVQLLGLMQDQVDIAKPGEDAQALIMLPGAVLCTSQFAVTARQFFTMEYKPGTTEANELGLSQTPRVIGVHRSFLHNRDDFVAMLPNPQMQGVVELQYFMNRRRPSIVWQTAPEVGRTFENGEIAARLDMPVRVTMARPKGTFASFTS